VAPGFGTRAEQNYMKNNLQTMHGNVKKYYASQGIRFSGESGVALCTDYVRQFHDYFKKFGGGRKLHFSDRQLQLFDNKITIKKYRGLSLLILVLHVQKII